MSTTYYYVSPEGERVGVKMPRVKWVDDLIVQVSSELSQVSQLPRLYFLLLPPQVFEGDYYRETVTPGDDLEELLSGQDEEDEYGLGYHPSLRRAARTGSSADVDLVFGGELSLETAVEWLETLLTNSLFLPQDPTLKLLRVALTVLRQLPSQENLHLALLRVAESLDHLREVF